jgi:hypothetical protein
VLLYYRYIKTYEIGTLDVAIRERNEVLEIV